MLITFNINQKSYPMRSAIAILTFALLLITASAQAQDTARKQQPNPPAKTANPAPAPGQTNPPPANKIAVSDPGVPVEKPTTNTSKRSTAKPVAKKKKSTATPK